MLQTIHDKLKGIFAIAILVALGVVFVFWGINVGSDFGGITRAKGVEVNGREIPVADIQRSYQDELSRFQAAMADAEVPEEVRTAMQKQAVEGAVRAELMRQRTTKLGFEATNAEVIESLREVPAFLVDGKFSADAYHATLRANNMSPERFEAEQRQYVLTRHLDRGLYQSAFVLPSELARDAALRNETRTIGWVTVPATEFLAAAAIDEAAIRTYYEANQSRFMTEEQASVDYVELDIEAFANQVQVTEAALRGYYEENEARFTQPGRRHARHILIAGDDAAAEARAKKAYERARAGEDFAKLAQELSDDTSSKDAGGDLGEAERAAFVEPFADAVWGMQPGEIRGPVKTEFGWHVIKLESVTPDVTQSFDEVRAELEPEFRRTQVEKAFGDAQEELDTLAFEAQGDLAAVAAKLNLPLKHSERYTRAGSTELGSVSQVTQAVFSPEVLAGRELRTVELEPGKVVALGVKEHQPARPKPLDEVRAEVVEAARLEAAGRLAAARAGEVASALAKGAAVWPASVAKWRGEGETENPKPVGRKELQVPAEVRAAAFAAPTAAGKPQYGVATLENGDSAIWTVTAITPGKLDTLSADERQAANNAARDRQAMLDATAYIIAMRANAEVDVNPKLFE